MEIVSIFKKNMVLTAISGFAGILSFVLAAKYIGPSQAGAIVALRALYPSASLSIFDFGLNDLITRIYSKAKKYTPRRNRFLMACMLNNLIIYGLISLLLTQISTHQAPIKNSGLNQMSYSQILVSISMLIPLFAAGTVAESCLKGCHRFLYLRLSEFTHNACILVAIVIAIVLSDESELIEYILLISTIRYSISMIYLIYLLKPRQLQIRWNKEFRSSTKVVLILSRPFFVNKIMALPNLSLPIALPYLFNTNIFGQYLTLTRLQSYAKGFLGQCSGILFPIHTRLKSNGTDYITSINIIINLVNYLVIIACCFLFGLSKEIITFFGLEPNNVLVSVIFAKTIWLWAGSKCGLVSIIFYGESKLIGFINKISLLTGAISIFGAIVIFYTTDVGIFAVAYGELAAILVALGAFVRTAKTAMPTLKLFSKIDTIVVVLPIILWGSGFI